MHAMSYEAHQELMTRAFSLVCPREHALRLADYGLVPREAAEAVSWKGEISALVTDVELKHADVTIDQVREAVIHFTATVPSISREQISGRPWTTYKPAKPGYWVRAAGYAAGPAGDW